MSSGVELVSHVNVECFGVSVSCECRVELPVCHVHVECLELVNVSCECRVVLVCHVNVACGVSVSCECGVWS